MTSIIVWSLAGLIMLGVLVWAFFLRNREPINEQETASGKRTRATPQAAGPVMPGDAARGLAGGRAPGETSFNPAPRVTPAGPLPPVFGFSFPRALTATLTRDEGIDLLPAIASDGAGNWVSIWTSTLPLPDTPNQTDSLIYFSRAGDDGMWSAPQGLNPDRAPGSRSGSVNGGPQIVSDGVGVWVVAWFSNDQLDGSAKDDDILHAVSVDAGATWSAPAFINQNAREDSGVDTNPRLAADGQNNWVAVWESLDTLGDTIGPDRDLLVSVSGDGAGTWSAPRPLNTNAASDAEAADRNASIATDRNGVWMAVWERIDKSNKDDEDEDLYFARSTDAGLNWTDPARLNTNGATDAEMDSMPRITTDGHGTWVVVWFTKNDLGGSGRDADIAFTRSEDNGVTWSEPAPLHAAFTKDSRPDYSPQISTNRGGDWLVVWESLESGAQKTGDDSDLWISRSTDRGRTWTEPAPLNSNATVDSQGDFAPAIANNGDKTWVVLWNSKEDIGAALGQDQDILATQSFNLDQAP